MSSERVKRVNFNTLSKVTTLDSLLSITQFMLSHVGLKLTPLALYKSVREDHEELGTPVDAINYILRHSHSNLNNNYQILWSTPEYPEDS